ncbi:MAG: hypothetical protein A4E63_02345 [Syntrophorhabdus sp. PtaU1.Bin050]|nr:MAG: hypothetical protein A4E63_02345 [Syntrophorhabdus sp. PtaU1.Bin050]
MQMDEQRIMFLKNSVNLCKRLQINRQVILQTILLQLRRLAQTSAKIWNKGIKFRCNYLRGLERLRNEFCATSALKLLGKYGAATGLKPGAKMPEGLLAVFRPIIFYNLL